MAQPEETERERNVKIRMNNDGLKWHEEYISVPERHSIECRDVEVAVFARDPALFCER